MPLLFNISSVSISRDLIVAASVAAAPSGFTRSSPRRR